MKRPAKQSQNAKREKLITSFLRNSEMANTIVFMTNFRRIKNRRTKENVWETICQKFGLTAEAVPETDAFFDVLSSFSSQNITEKQISSQKSSSSIHSSHFNFNLGGKKNPSASLFHSFIRFKRFNGDQRIARMRLSFFHLGKLLPSDKDDPSDSDDYFKTGL